MMVTKSMLVAAVAMMGLAVAVQGWAGENSKKKETEVVTSALSKEAKQEKLIEKLAKKEGIAVKAEGKVKDKTVRPAAPVRSKSYCETARFRNAQAAAKAGCGKVKRNKVLTK